MTLRSSLSWFAALVLTACAAQSVAPTPPSSNDGAPQVYVPAGEFTMGSDILPGERPVHIVNLHAFWIDRYETTNALYQKCVAAGVCPLPQGTSTSQGNSYADPAQGNFPVSQVTWAEADQYCRWAGKRLPTEAEWEKAARGADARVYPWGSTFDADRVNSAYNTDLHAVVVGSYPAGASPYGALDMAGNVWEWVADWYNEHYYAQAPRDNPPGPPAGRQKVARGGGYGGTEAVMRTSQRRELYPDDYGGYLGFRCARD